MSLDSLSERLYTAVLSDVLDSIGLRNQSPDVELHSMTGVRSLLGYAKTLQWEDYVDAHGDPYEMLIEAVDSVKPGEVVVSAVSGDNRSALWGELLSTATRIRGGRGAIVDGAVRDVDQMEEMGFPCFARSKTPRDSAHRQNIVAIDEPVMLGGVRIEPGDMVMIDMDGMVVIPSERAEDVINLALEKVEKEDTTRQELLKGRLLGDVYREYGVL
jgi:4-hydroxy-4-methyl-2-oxoglutarate aldolase